MKQAKDAKKMINEKIINPAGWFPGED